MLFKPANVRTRLTAWYVLVLTAILLAYAGISIVLIFFDMRGNLDRQLENDFEILEDHIEIDPNGQVRVGSQDESAFHERWIELWSMDGKLIFESKPFTARSLPPAPPPDEIKSGLSFKTVRLAHDTRFRILQGKTNVEGTWLVVRLVRSEDHLWREVRGYVWLMLLSLPIAILVAGAGGYLLAKRALKPVDQMAARARQISGDNLQARLPVVNPHDELGHLATLFNELLDRIHRAFVRLKQFTSDAAHELRTPLTTIRSIGEVSLQEKRQPDYYRNVIGSILEENKRLTHLVDSLLFLSRVDSENFKLDVQPTPLRPFVEKSVEFIQALAEEKGQKIHLQGNTDISARMDHNLMREALLNLLDNAIKYSAEGSEITVEVRADTNQAMIAVRDQGPGIPENELDKIFERFYRIDKGRAREMGGSGLGLAIARWAVQVQGGSIQVESRVGQGSIFTITLPVR